MASTNPMARVIPGPQARWNSSMEAFAAADRERSPVTDGVIFVGSSTIRMWSHLSQDFRQFPVLNRGFGGSTMADCQYFARQLVLQYKPRQVLVYAGDNDLAEGRTPQQVVESFRGFVDTVRQDLPDTRISYISIKPSPSRAALLPKIRETNALMANYVRSLPNAAYIDIFTAMLDSAGNPRVDLFGPDRLHMNDTGYALWTSIVGAYVQPMPGTQTASSVPTEVAAPVAKAVGTPAPAAAAVVAPPAVVPPLNAMRAVYRP
ncbi:SGNH/GDSL hydrolase family protein [Xylophilus sp. GOD-11R]|nr:SGNH/GDSL hydrolase family protein [Xylophilus sp. GOD-11R]WPB59444.1 SGNH/GDSL hydrolase family protein [Xylophilus sp. GOD-11R]